MPQAVQVEAQPKQQGLARLHPERVTGRTGREFALHRGEDAFDQSAAPIDPMRKGPSHYRPHSAHAPSFLPTLGGDHALGPEPLADISGPLDRPKV